MSRTQNMCPGSKMFLTLGKNIFLFTKQQKFVSATMFPSLARPLYLRLTLYGNECVKSRST